MRAPIGTLNFANERCCIGRGLAALSALPNVEYGFLYYALKSKVAELNAKGTGSTFKAINKRALSAISIVLPPLAIQRRIAAKLDRLCDIVAKRKDQLSQLNQLVKSRFVEMFGEDRYKMEPLSQNVVEMFIGPFGSSLKNECFVEKSDAYCMVYEQKHAIRKTLIQKTRYVDKNKYEELKRFTVLGGDIIVSCRGTVGEVFALPRDAPLGIMHPSIMKIRINEDVYDKVYFVFALRRFMSDHLYMANGSGVKMAITATALGKEVLAVPPLALQREFAAFVEKVDKLAAAVKRGLEAAERLYRQQMQEFFGEAATKTAETTKTTKTANAGGFSLSGLSTPSQGLNSPVGHRAKGGNANG